MDTPLFHFPSCPIEYIETFIVIRRDFPLRFLLRRRFAATFRAEDEVDESCDRDVMRRSRDRLALR